MQEITVQNKAVQYVFRPQDEEKSDSITNDYLEKMPRDENLRYELIGGEIVVSTAPRFIHQLLATRIIVQFATYFEKNPTGEILTTPGLIFSKFDGVIPDLIYISHEKIDEILNQKSGKFHGAPEIVIEILSPGRANSRRDLQIKRELYEIYEVPEYWVVNPFDKQITVFNRKKGLLQETQTFGENDKFSSEILPKLKIDIKKLFEN